MDDKSILEYYKIDYDKYNDKKLIGEGPSSKTYSSVLSNKKYVLKFLKNEEESKLNEYLFSLHELQHDGIIGFNGYSLSNENIIHQNIISFNYAENLSLKHILNLKKDNNFPNWWCQEQQYIIIYGVAQTMKFLHEKMITHGRLTLTNILLNESLEPLISDFGFYNLTKFDFTPENIAKYDLLYYISPETIANNQITGYSDIFAFAIIVIQILSSDLDIYNKTDQENFQEKIQSGLLPTIPSYIPQDFKDLLKKCLQTDPNTRPSFKIICEELDKIIESLPDISNSMKFKYYKEKITKPSKLEEVLSPEIQKMKDEADNGDAINMELYSRNRLLGINCQKNINEGIKYHLMALENGYNEKDSFIPKYTKRNYDDDDSDDNDDDDDDDDDDDENDDFTSSRQENTEEKDSFIDNNIFEEPECDIIDELNNITEDINKKEEDIKIIEFPNLNFVYTDESIHRLKIIIYYLKKGIPILLEGDTGTAKTLSSEIACKLIGREIKDDETSELIRFNVSSDTKPQDLIGRYVNDETSWAGISQHDGPFLKAIKEGKILLLDEINLGSVSVLQIIEEALDSGFLSIEISGRPLEKIAIHENFRLIATQNPNKGYFDRKRQELGLKFLSKFQIISFSPFTKKVLHSIAIGTAAQYKYKNTDVLQQVVDFHYEWSDKKDDIQYFTIREIRATIKALSEDKDINQTIMTIYGARYEKETRNQMEELIEKNYPLLKKTTEDVEIPEFPWCYKNSSLKDAVSSSLFSLNNGRHILLTGKKGCGKTQVALWLSEYYNNNVKKANEDNSDTEEEEEDPDNNDLFLWYCTEETKVADLIGRQTPVKQTKNYGEIIKWQDGFLIVAIKKGMSAVLESLDGAPSTVAERLNGLLDQKFDNLSKTFYVQESTRNPYVSIKDSFRIIATCDIDNISKLSPALLNRFDIIVLENQIEDDISPFNFKKLLQIKMEEYLQNALDTKNTSEPEKQVQSDENKHTESAKKVEQDGEEEEEEEEDGFVLIGSGETESLFTINDFVIDKSYELMKDIRNISEISRITKSIVKICVFFHETIRREKISDESLIEFAYSIHKGNKEDIPEDIETALLSQLKNNENGNDDPFFYDGSKSLKIFFAKLMAYSIVCQPVCITGPTGVGKTTCARAFSMKKGNNPGFQMLAFHSGTRVTNIFGNTTIINKEIKFLDSALTKAMKKGIIFIADEFNLSPSYIMNSTSVALDQTIGKKAYIPGTGESIKIHHDFLFIVCQNSSKALGRTKMPDSISSRFKKLRYPNADLENIQSICVNVAQNIISSDSQEEFAKQIANYMVKINQSEQNIFPKWSIRDIKKLFKRIFKNHTKKIYNFTRIHHVLFYTMSSVSSDNLDAALKEVRTYLMKSFDIKDDEKVEYYIKCYTDEPKMVKIAANKYSIEKNDCKIEFNVTDDLVFNQKLPTLWNAFFQIYIAHPSEPILLIGNSGYKTFLSKLFLPSAEILTLNQETTIVQLLGSSDIMTADEAQLFYIDNICKIISDKNHEIRSKWANGTLKDEIDNLITEEEMNKRRVPKCFQYALKNFAHKLYKKNDEDQNSLFYNTVLEFRPGLFLNAILKKQSLILKDLSNLLTVVFERFNEFFSGKASITLTEDEFQTFTSKDFKELTGLDELIQVIATSSLNSVFKISEPILSRFTTIFCPSYEPEEQKDACKSYITFHKLCFNLNKNNEGDDIDKLKVFANSFDKEFGSIFTFPQKIKVIEIASKMNNNTSIKYQKMNIGISLYRVLSGNIDPQLKPNLCQLINSIYSLPDFFEHPDNEKCQLIINPSKFYGLKSNITQLFIKYPNTTKSKKKLAITGSFNDLLDVIQMGLTINNPIILEGQPGLGKHTAINYVADILKIKVIRIIISQTTKVQDLFGKNIINTENDKKNGSLIEMVETEFLKSIKSESNERVLIVLENLNNASPALLNCFVPVFDSKSSKILLPNGNPINKGKFNIIGIFNTLQFSSSKDILPSSLNNSSINYIVTPPKPEEIKKIIEFKFKLAGLPDDESERFYIKFMKAKEVTQNEGIVSQFTLNDIEKYILFRKIHDGFFDESFVSEMIFAYQFSSYSIFQKMINELKLENAPLNPVFCYDDPPPEDGKEQEYHLIIQMSKDDKKGLPIKLYKRLDNKELKNKILSKINSLTETQKRCLIFLACSLLTKRVSVIQGSTASGKSFLIQLLAELLNAKLHIFQMNSECNLSMLATQPKLEKELTENEKISLMNLLTILLTDKQIREYNNDELNIDPLNPTTYSYSKLNQLMEFISEIYPRITEKNNNINHNISHAYKSIIDIINPTRRLKNVESTFIQAMKNGDIVLIDGIESATSAIAEKISSLCGENPELNLFEYGKKYHFYRNSSNPDYNINENFHLFITYNYNSSQQQQEIDQSFKINSINMSLPPFDEKIEDVVQFLFGLLMKKSYPIDLAKQIAARFAKVHNFAKNESINNPDNFAGGIMFTGRTLKHLMQSFPNYKAGDKNSLSRIIVDQIFISIRSFYANSYIDNEQMKSKDFYNQCISEFTSTPNISLFDKLDYSEMNFSDKNKNFLKMLMNIQNYDSNISNNQEFSLMKLIDDFQHIKVAELPNAKEKIDDTIECIKRKKNLKDRYKNEYFIKFGSLLAFDTIINSKIKINKYNATYIFNDNELLNDKGMKPVKLRFKLLQSLLASNLFAESSSIILENKLFYEIIEKTALFTKKPSKKLFNKLFKNCVFNEEDLLSVEKVFPYLLFSNAQFNKSTNKQDISRILYWLHLSKILIKNKIHFTFTLSRDKKEFVEKSNADFEVNIVLNEENNFSLSTGSTILYDLRSGKKPQPEFLINRKKTKNHKKSDLVFYRICLKLAESSNFFVSEQIMQTNINDAKNDYREYKIICPEDNSILSIKDLFINDELPLISMIWNLVYTLPKEQLNYLSQIIHPLQSKLLRSAYEMLKNPDVDKIIVWSKWAVDFDNNTNHLKDIYFRKTIENLENINSNIVTEINDEIKYLEKSPINDETWSSNDLINILKEKRIHYQNLLKDDSPTNEEEKIIQDLKKELLRLDVHHPKYADYKEDLLNMLNKLSEINEKTADKLNLAIDLVHKFLKIVNTHNLNKRKGSFIQWPKINFDDDLLIDTNTSQNANKQIELFNALIWYSQVFNIVKDLANDNKITESFWKLIDFTEMEYPRSEIIQDLSLNGLIIEVIEKTRHTLNANMILKLFLIDNLMIKSPATIYNIINSYIDRNSYPKDELQWIYKSEKVIASDYILNIPTVLNQNPDSKTKSLEFEPIDLIYLVTYPKSANSCYAGPLFKSCFKNDDPFLISISDLVNKTYHTFLDAAMAIGELYYLYRIDKNEKRPIDLKKMSNKFSELKQRPNEIFILFEIAEGLDKWKEESQKLNFDDVLLLSENWTNNNDFLQNYPSLFYWMMQNYKLSHQFVERIPKIRSDLQPNQIPFWVINLRIRSSKECIKFESKTEGGFSLAISSVINSKVTEYLNNSILEKKQISYDWFVLLLSDAPAMFNDDSLRTIHDFFISLSEDEKLIPFKLINGYKLQYTKQFVSDIMDQILFKNNKNILNENILNENSMFKFLFSPTKIIQKQIEDSGRDIVQLVQSDEKINKFKDTIRDDPNQLLDIINEIKNAIENDKKAIKSEYLPREKRTIRESIDTYNSCIDQLIRHKEYNLVRSDIPPLVNKLNLRENELKNYSQIFKCDGIYVQTIEYSSYNKCNIRIRKQDNSYEYIDLPRTGSGHQKINYLFPNEYFVDKFNYNDYARHYAYAYFRYIKEEFSNDVNHFEEMITSSIQLPILDFGKTISRIYMRENDFLDLLTQLDESIKKAMSNLSDIKYNGLKIDSFEIFDTIYSLIAKLQDNLDVKFSDGHPAEKTFEILQGKLKSFLNYIHPLNFQAYYFNFTKVKPFFKDMNKWSSQNTIFKNQYDIHIPNISDYQRYKPNFKKLNDINYISEPVLSMSDKNTIICSVKKLQKQFSPIFPSLVDGNFSISIISLVKCEIKCKIENLEGNAIENVITSKKAYKKNESIEILIKIPHANKENLIKPIKINGNLIIESEKTTDFVLPFEFTLIFLPITAILHCEQYKLENEKPNYFKLCCNKIVSGSRLDFLVNDYFKRPNDNYEFDFAYESLSENEAMKPEKIFKKKYKFAIKVGQVFEPKRCQFHIVIAFSQNIKYFIYCDFIITPFVLAFEMYDYLAKKYVSDTCCFIRDYKIKNKVLPDEIPQQLYFRIVGLYPFQKKGRITYNLPSFIKINDTSILNREIDFNDGYNFTLNVTFQKKASFYYGNEDNNDYNFTLEIEGIKKVIKIKFIRPMTICDELDNPKITEFIQKTPCYCFNYELKQWSKINNGDEIRNLIEKIEQLKMPYIIVTPYYYETNKKSFKKIKYKNDRHTDAKNNYIKYSSGNDEIIFLKVANTDNEELLYKESNSPMNEEINGLYYYTIIGYFNDNRNIWFPVFNIFPEISDKNLLPYNIDELSDNTIENAKNTMNEIKSELMHEPLSPKNFINLSNLLLEKQIVIHIKSIINRFPQEINDKFEIIYNDIKDFLNKGNDITQNELTLISHNLIIWFAQVFIDKYNELASHKFYPHFPLKEKEIFTKMRECVQELYYYDTSGEYENSKETENQFIQKEYELSKFTLTELPDESNQHEFFIINENSNPKPWKPSDTFVEYEFPENTENDNSNVSDDECLITNLPEIKIPEVFTITSLREFYLTCSLGATILPSYIKNCQQQNKNQEESEMYYAMLFKIYDDITNETMFDSSIISSYVNEFIESFKICYKKLLNAGAQFMKKIYGYTINKYNQCFELGPKQEKPNLDHYVWKTKNQFSYNFINYIDPLNSHSKFFSIENINSDYKFTGPGIAILEGKNNENNEKNSNEREKPKIESEINENITVANVYSTNQVDANTENEEEENKEIENKERPDLSIDINDIIDSQSVTVQPDFIDNLKLMRLDFIDSIIERIRSKRNDERLKDKLTNNSECIIENADQLFNVSPSYDDLPVKNLIYGSNYLTACLVKKASDTKNIPYNNISCNLLIDCSSFINEFNKLFNFMLLTAFSYALSTLEIPFSITIFSDKNYRYVLKQFDEKISMFVLQRVLDCLFIQRFQSNLADTVNHAINYFDIKDSNRTERAIFIFSNGIDDNLALAEQWNEILLNNQSISFGFIFGKSQLLDNEKFSVIKKMWDDFNEITKNAKSKTELIYYTFNADIDSKDNNQYDSIFNLFAHILSRPQSNELKQNKNINIHMPEFKNTFAPLSQRAFNTIKNNFEYDFSNATSTIYFKENQNIKGTSPRFTSINLSKWMKKFSNKKSNDKEFDLFIHSLVHSTGYSPKQIYDSLFKPNRALMQSLSDNGGEIDITELIMYLILRHQNPHFYLEYKDCLVRNYGITIIIDSSKSCFNDHISSGHSYQTIKNLFVGLSTIYIPCIDIIVATKDKPIILSREVPSQILFNEKSSFWNSLFSCLAEIHYSLKDDSLYCNMESAIQTAYALKNSRSVDYTSYIFILTDGLYQEEQKEIIKGHIINCSQHGITTYGIGIGFYPEGIQDIFRKSIYSPNPNNLNKALLLLFGSDSGKSNKSSFDGIAQEKASFSKINEIFNNIIQNKDKAIFHDLKYYLSNIPMELDAFRYNHNEEREVRDGNNEIVNNEGVDSQIYIRDSLKGQRILLLMPHDCSENRKEHENMDPKYLMQPSDINGNLCVKDAVEYFGIELDIVRNYKEFINKLKETTPEGKCKYYAVWILSGYPYDMEMPNNGNKHLVLQFIECLYEFWTKKGSVILFAEGKPFTFEINLFLERIRFPGPVEKTNLRLGGEHKGKTDLIADRNGKLDRPSTFNKKYPLRSNNVPRTHPTHNLVKFYSGETISFYDGEDYAPFVPFMKDSQNGYCGFYYQGDADPKNLRGDIIIDCGYTKLFDNMTSTGTFKLVQNYAGWTAQFESREFANIPPKFFHPDAITFNLDEKAIYNGFEQHPSVGEDIDLSKLKKIFAIDVSGSLMRFKEVSGGGYRYNELENDYYHEYFDEILNNISKSMSNDDTIMIWSTDATKISKDQLLNICRDPLHSSVSFTQGTRPAKIIERLVENPNIPREHLIIVTDGEVLPRDIQECDEAILKNNISFQYVTTYVIGQDGDLSANAPFIRYCGSKTVNICNNLRTPYYTSATDLKSLDTIDSIKTIKQFTEISEVLIEATWNRLKGTKGNKELDEKYQNLKNRLCILEGYNDDIESDLNHLIGMAKGNCENALNRSDLTTMEKRH